MNSALTVSETKTIYVVRDSNHEVLDVCELYTTADRLTAANVDKGAYFTQELGLRIGANWFYPGKLAEVTQADLRSNVPVREFAMHALADFASAAPRKLTQAAQDVLAERRRQVEVEGWTPEHDDKHTNDELAALACFYAMPSGAREWSGPDGYGDTLGESIRPAGWWQTTTGDRRRETVKAGALILAEIERLDRVEAAKNQPLASEELQKYQETKRKALKAGLSDDDIALLAGPKPKK